MLWTWEYRGPVTDPFGFKQELFSMINNKGNLMMNVDDGSLPRSIWAKKISK